jgi:polyhydroxyalkanoate synthesis regulator phasin
MAAPRWKRVFDTVERSIGRPLEELVQQERFADAIMLANRLNAAGRRTFERNTRRALHLMNLPAGSDVKRLHEQIWALEREVRDLNKRLETSDREEP